VREKKKKGSKKDKAAKKADKSARDAPEPTPPPAETPPPTPQAAPTPPVAPAVQIPQYSQAESQYNRMVADELAAAQHAARRPGAPGGGPGAGGMRSSAGGMGAQGGMGGTTTTILGKTLGGTLGKILAPAAMGPGTPGQGRVNKTINGQDPELVALESKRLGQRVHALFNGGQYREALDVAEQQMKLLQSAYGSDHHEYATAVNNVATLYQALGRHNEAEPLLQQASRIQEKKLGHEHPHTLASLANLATVYEAMGQKEKADALNVLVREMRRRWEEKQVTKRR